MSGLEILGIAASIIQIADVGVNVSVKLCTFIHQVKNVNQSVQSLSNDVALTSSVLRHLGENLQQDEQARLCSAQAVTLAQNVLGKCGKVFDQINAAIEQPAPNDVKSRLLRSVRKVGLVLSDRDMDALRSNLDRLKSTMLLMLNVIMYAGQLRSRKDSVALQDQRSLVQALAEKQNNNGQIGQTLCAQSSTQQSDTFSIAVADTGSKSLPDPTIPDNLPEELRTYYLLIKKLLGEVDLCQSKLQPKRYISIRNGLLRVHTDEKLDLELQYGQDTCQVLHEALFGDEGTGGVTMDISNPGASSDQEDVDDDRHPPRLSPFKPNYVPREETPPPFATGAICPMSDAEAGEERASCAVGNSVLIRFLDNNRPDIAGYERSHPFRLDALPPSDVKTPENALNVLQQKKQSALTPDCSTKPDPVPSIDDVRKALNSLSQENSQSPSTPSPSTGAYSKKPTVDPPYSHPPPIAPALQGPNITSTNYQGCNHPGCVAPPPFETQEVLDSNTKMHSINRPYYCPERDCSRSMGGKGFKRENEMIRHRLIHNSPGYICPFCSDQERKFPRPDNLQRHVRIHHIDVDRDHPLLRQVLAQHTGMRRGRRRRVERNDKPDVPPQPGLDIVDSLLLAWTTLGKDEVSVPAPHVQD